MIRRALLLAVLLLASHAAAAAAQGRDPMRRPRLDLWAGFGLPAGEMADPVDPGWTLSGDVVVPATPRFSLYAGYSYARFAFKDAISTSLEVQGPEAGVRVMSGRDVLVVVPFQVWANAGATYYQADFDSDNGQRVTSLERRLGFQGGIGMTNALRPGALLSLAAQLSHTPGGESGSDCPPFDCPVTYVTLRAGISLVP